MKKSESDVQKMVQSFKVFLNPFDPLRSDKLVSLSSGLQAPSHIETDLLTLQQHGIQQYKKFIRERPIEKNIIPCKHKRSPQGDIHVTYKKKSNFKDFKETNSETDHTKKCLWSNTFTSQENNLDIQKVMEYPLGPVPWALGTADGMPIKTDKAVLMPNLEDASSQKVQQRKEITYMLSTAMPSFIVSIKSLRLLVN